MNNRYRPVQLAQHTFPWLSVQVTRVASQKVDPKLGKLGGHLCIFAERLPHLSDSQKRRLEHHGTIRRLLTKLETALSASSNPTKIRHGLISLPFGGHLDFPLLTNIAIAMEDANDGGHKGVRALPLIEPIIRNALLKGNIDYAGIFSTFVEVSEIGQEDNGEVDEALVPQSPSGKDDFAGYERYAKALYKVLVRYGSCNCDRQDQNDRHWARLRLKPLYQANENNQIPFDMLFSASPNPPRTVRFEWQHVRVFVPTSKSRRKVQWAQQLAPAHEADQPDGTDNEAYERIETLCTLIASRCGSLLCFKAAGDHLMVLRGATDLVSQHNVKHDTSPGLHLGQVLDRFNMRHGMRPVLAYILAKAAWYYYDSEWTSMGVSNDCVYFMGETLEDEVVYFCKPYLSAQLPPQGSQMAECRQVVGMIHRYPRILALGVMLVEIATGQRFEMEGRPDQWDPKTANQQLLTLQKHLNNGEFHEDCRFPRYKAAVNKCLDPMLFRNAPFNPKKPTENLEQRRSILYNEIVDPLRQLIEGTGWDDELDDIEQTALVPKPRAKTGLKPPAHFIVSEMAAPAAPAVPKGDPWLEEITVLNKMLKAERRKASTRNTPFKVAILDTGYDDSSPTFDIPGRSRKVKGWKDFVSCSPHPVDTDGHGTHLLTLLLQLECPANIYVARVTESSKTLNSAERNIAEAIRMAALEWDVDFVSLSFGFPRHIQGIREAIADAVYAKRGAITFFAAANNDGFNRREMFPANLGESVISVRGTNRTGSFEPKYNPPTSSDEPVFGTLGVDVLSDWPGFETGKLMSGCSVATPIAVAIAVMLLEYAVARPREFDPDDLKLIRTRRGVFEMFKEISVHAGDHRHYVAPFNLFRLSEDVRLAKMKTALGRHPERW
ncbi:uncharacterized protein B0H64DRAFT_337797 [Chaetomium fimeti]|uniref:Peptidase S8/S53 domain-containing protein n=1 Tax=Chaetomium fimeti TaxID=1854472 RepID=A0AAE0LW06_9PEZI|nr:hypothetical protein B0H64DRAFT_337797 [Chaetomium fimeti]